MKKFVAIAASAVLAMSVCAFTACGEDDVRNYKYTEVDLSTSAKRAEFVDMLVENVDLNKLFGDINAEDFALGLAMDFDMKLDVNASAKGVDLPSFDKPVDLNAGVEVEISNPGRLKYSAGKLESEASTNLKGGVTVSDEIYTLLTELTDLDEDTVDTIKSLITKFDYTTRQYCDGEYIYAEYPASLLEDILPEEVMDQLSFLKGGKIKLPMDAIIDDFPIDVSPVLGGSSALLSATTVAAAETDPTKAMMKGYVTTVVEYLYEYKVKVETSTTDGYAIRLSANSSTIWNAIEEIIPDDEALAVVGDIVTVNTFDIVACFAVDKEGAFKEVSVSLDIDADVSADLAELLEEEGAPVLEGSAKLSLSWSFKSYNGKISAPSNPDEYVDLTDMLKNLG